MPFKIDKLPDEPILTVSVVEPLNLRADMHPYSEELIAILDESQVPLYEIMDARAIKLTFADMVSALALATRDDDSTRIRNHPNMRAWIVVLDNDVLRMGANALGQAQYGGKAVPVFKTVEEAVTYARKQIADQVVQS